MTAQRGDRATGAGAAIVAASLLGLGGIAWADDDPFAMLRERDRAWTFELVRGPSLAALAAVTGAPHVRCRVAESTTAGALPRSRIECAPLGDAAPELAASLAQRFTLVFEPTGVRELVLGADDPARLADRSNAGAFTFPRTLVRRWRHDVRDPDGARAVVAVRDELATVRGARTRLWIAEASYHAPARDGVAPAPVLGAAAFAPGIGPALKCTIARERSTTYTCLRLIADPVPADRAAKPQPRVTLVGKTAHDRSSLSASAVAAKLGRSYLPGIRRCYAAWLRRKPAARGALGLGFTVNAVGKLADPSVRAPDDVLAGCVHDAMASWRFPIPQSEYSEPRNARFTIELRLAPE